MSLLSALTATTTREAALAYVQAGISIVPLQGKRAHIMWEPFQKRVMSAREAAYWWRPQTTLNIGIILGDVSGGLVCIDLDGGGAAKRFMGQFPALANTLGVTTGSGDGYHLYYRVRSKTVTLRAMGLPEGNIELRAGGSYVVAPGGIHPLTGARYEVSNLREPLELEDLEAVADWIQAIRDEHHQKASAAELRAQRGAGQGKPSIGYAQAALRSAVTNVEQSAPDTHNITLYRQALSLGNFVPDGDLSESEIEAALLPAARAVGQGEREAIATIRSGIRNGMKHPRSARR